MTNIEDAPPCQTCGGTVHIEKRRGQARLGGEAPERFVRICENPACELKTGTARLGDSV